MLLSCSCCTQFPGPWTHPKSWPLAENEGSNGHDSGCSGGPGSGLCLRAQALDWRGLAGKAVGVGKRCFMESLPKESNIAPALTHNPNINQLSYLHS